MRYDVFAPPTEEHDYFGKFDPSLHDALIDAGVNQVSRAANVQSRHDNFSPHVGFAYDPLGDGKMLVRGGFALFYYPLAALRIRQ